MPQVVTKTLLSGSTNGKGIKVAATSSPGTTIHTAVASTSSMDEIWLYCYNSDTVTRTLNLQWGGTTSPDDDIVIDIPSKQGRFLIVDGALLQNTLVVKAYCAAAANVLIITGFVNAIV
jgi:hypothetical protein